MAVCSNCGGSEFVWADAVRTGFVGRGKLALRSRGELALGTRICRTCGHADLFLRDPTILKEPHRWKEGEFRPHVAHSTAPPPVAAAAFVAEPVPTPVAVTAESPPEPVRAPPTPPEAPAAATGESSPADPKRVPRRRSPAKSKSSSPALIHD